jgi:hypothetical protein
MNVMFEQNEHMRPEKEYERSRGKLEKVFKFCVRYQKYKYMREIIKIININDVYQDQLANHGYYQSTIVK